jgi:hypothetical protein
MRNTLFLVFLAVSFLSACAPATPAQTGALQGRVTIGPLVPVEIEGVPPPAPAPEVFAARQVVVFTPDGEREIARAQIDAQGVYRLELLVGDYLVDINRLGIDSAAGLPVIITIRPDEITTLDIDIDTGIR